MTLRHVRRRLNDFASSLTNTQVLTSLCSLVLAHSAPDVAKTHATATTSPHYSTMALFGNILNSPRLSLFLVYEYRLAASLAT